MIDAHVHFWRPDRGDYGWLTPDLTSLYRPILPDEFQPMLDRYGINGVVAVQAAPTEAETRYLFDLAVDHRWIRGIVGWVDFDATDGADRIARLVEDGCGRLKGLRPMLHDLDDPAWVARPALDRAFAAMTRYDLAFDALVRPEHLSALSERLKRSPDLRVVIDHGAKPDIGGGSFDEWTALLQPLADMPTVHCKLSGLLTEAGGQPPDIIERYADHILEAFGAERTIWGSDWPVLTLASDYDCWFRQARSLIDRLGNAAAAAVFENNARAFYRLDPATS